MTAQQLFIKFFSREPDSVTAIALSGSHRRYFRLVSGADSVIGVEGTDIDENLAFLSLDRHFSSKGIRVPKILAVSSDSMTYLLEDLGDEILFARRDDTDLLEKTVRALPKIQCEGAEGLNWRLCYPQSEFDARMVGFDLNYFKYCYLKRSGVEFNEVRLQDDFDALSEDLLEGMKDCNTFMYRDFQARNVIIRDGEPHFIDFQGGRRGPLQYDLASFVWQAKAGYSPELRERLVSAYLDELEKYLPGLDREEFCDRLQLFVLFRTLQVLGAYGYRGLTEGKPHFIESIPYALENLRSLLPLPQYPYLSDVLLSLTEQMPASEPISPESAAELAVDVWSFSYKKGIPADESGNGGGYVFDCRYVNNPGRYEQYRNLTGRDREVIDFLEKDGEITVFLKNVDALVDAHVRRFVQRGFTHLTVCFGCTGGHHRSVYSAEHVARRLAAKFGVTVRLHHRELGIEETL